MNVDKTVIRALRKAKLWSQEELAVACGVGLRTIQRVEGEGSASMETVKALAAVFNTSPEQLFRNPLAYSNYYNVQLGTFLLLVFGAIFILETWLFQQGKMSENGYIISVILVGCLGILFPTLTTSVEADKIRWHFGLGLIRKSILISDVSHHRTVKNKVWWGVGIRLILGGWLYNVSGLNAVELVLKNGKTIRIGTDEPDEFNAAIKKRINHKL